jgi:hypothetical protein
MIRKSVQRFSEKIVRKARIPGISAGAAAHIRLKAQQRI